MLITAVNDVILQQAFQFADSIEIFPSNPGKTDSATDT
jgi:hypothetical protein